MRRWITQALWIMLAALLVPAGAFGSLALAAGEAGPAQPAAASGVALAPASLTFSDVSGHWAYSMLEWAYRNQIVNGYEDGTFRPDRPVTEAEFLVMLFRAYPDVRLPGPDGPWYAPYMAAAEGLGWPVIGDTDGARFNRGQAARLLAASQGRVLDLNSSIQLLLDLGLANGKTSDTIEGFAANDRLTRAEALTLIRRAVDGQLSIGQAELDREFVIRGIAMGDSEEWVLARLGDPARKDLSMYGFYWYIYNEDYSNYVQVGIEDGRVVALYSNSRSWSSASGIRVGSAFSGVAQAYGAGDNRLRKGNTIIHLATVREEASQFILDDSYATIFFDKHDEGRVTAILLIDREVEDAYPDLYPVDSSGELRAGYERQAWDLANAARARFGLEPFRWNEEVAATARKHSEDMAVNGFFNHTNLRGQSLTDRMKDDGITFRLAAENLAMGQRDPIFAHEGLMNSEGHRRNLLNEAERLGVGVHFGGSYNVYYTQKFYTP